MELIEKKKFAFAAVDLENKISIIYIAFFAIFDENYSPHRI